MKNATNLAELDYDKNVMDKNHSDRINLIKSKAFVYLPRKSKKGYWVLKKLSDFLLSCLGLIILFPLLLIVAIAIKLDSPGKIIYTQNRIGKNGKSFKMYKFRSMCDDAEKKQKALQSLNEANGPVFKIAKDPRVTRVGKFIRKCSIDELPQLLNILKGEMSIVGPRPPLPNEVAQYTPHQRLRLSVTPGLTCYWQVSGRSDMPFDKWVELDLKYIEDMSLWTDFYIFLRTIPAVLGHKGAY